MKVYDVQEIELAVPAERAFEWIADPRHLPEWTQAFAAADETSAVFKTPEGDVRIGLEVRSHRPSTTVDWHMRFPGGEVARAHSRIVELTRDRCVYAFFLLAPPVPLERIEGALEAQKKTLAQELRALKARLERR